MRAPRITVGVIADSSDTVELGARLAGVGHTVEWLDDVTQARNYELLIIAVRSERLDDVVEALASIVRRGQIVVHTLAGAGVQVLDSIEMNGGVVGAAYPLTPDLWAVTSTDDLGQTVIELLVGELGGRVISVPDSQRARLAAGLSLLSFVETVRADAISVLTEALGSPDIATELGAPGVARPLEGVRELEYQYRAITDPGMARAFKELARRTAEHEGATDVELWAYGG